jgi:hypothetical protein
VDGHSHITDDRGSGFLGCRRLRPHQIARADVAGTRRLVDAFAACRKEK